MSNPYPYTLTNPAAPNTPIGATDDTSPNNTLLGYQNDLRGGVDDFQRTLFAVESKTIASGSITVTMNMVIVDTEGAASADDLTNIAGYAEGRILYIRMANAARVVTLKNKAGGVGEIDSWGGADIVLSTSKWLKLVGTSTGWSDVALSSVGDARFQCDGRLTLVASTPVTTADVTVAAAVRFTPYKGNRLTLYTGAKWTDVTFSELSIATPAVDAQNYDVFVYLSSGTATLEVVAWTNDTTRATLVVRASNGVLVKSGDPTRLYLGTFRTSSGAGATEDSKTKRFLWNNYNRIPRVMQKTDTTDTWTYATAAWRQLNNSAGNRIEFVRGLNEDAIEAKILATSSASSTLAQAVALGLDSTTVPSGLIANSNDTAAGPLQGSYVDTPAEGYHYLQGLEYAGGATVTFYGDGGATYIMTGIHALVWA